MNACGRLFVCHTSRCVRGHGFGRGHGCGHSLFYGRGRPSHGLVSYGHHHGILEASHASFHGHGGVEEMRDEAEEVNANESEMGVAFEVMAKRVIG